ncbi:putative sulfate exporter family transporter [Desulfallas sp. Bu1-1]|uniref:putative sulfate exporter family transporter n=1 Tax=Desulfallas sp. Bu1-1 TaxID=2787620 RepID=UPI00189E34E9|nr:putative sulfate exporter family transporter [Desulfallas sp. Bu1-1]MBF7082599.1 putative sulfate exporter family transporter [Desulfallas sp. Bu1-1]
MNDRAHNENSLFKSEDWMAVWIGLFVFVLGLLAIGGNDVLGWAAKANTWTTLSKAVAPVSKAYEGMSSITSLILTYLFMLVITTIGAGLLGFNLKKFTGGFTLIFWITFVCWVAGHNAYIAATPDKLKDLGIPWSLNLTGEAGYIIALIVGLIIGNFFTGFAGYLKEAARPEWFIKTAIVIMGAALGVKACSALGLATTVMIRGLCAIIEAYLIYWAVVYYISRKYFKLNPEWSAPLAAGISICGVSAAIAAGGAIRSRPIIPVMVSSLVIIFAVVELVILPFAAQAFLHHEPMVAGAWMGLAVKTDGAAVASGAITDSLIRAKALAVDGVNYEQGWILMATTTTKIFIDMFIGIWAFLLAIVWVYFIDRKPGEKVQAVEIWNRFPKFVIGYFVTFIILLIWGLNNPEAVDSTLKLATSETDVFRQTFFAMTFFSIGVISNFSVLKQQGLGKLALVYVLALFGFIIWVGLLISWIFFHGIKPPIIGG